MNGRSDYATALTTSLLLFVGLIMLYSASAPFSLRHYGSDVHMLLRQLIAVGVGVVALVVLAHFDYHRLSQMNGLLLLGSVGLSLLTLLPLGISDGLWLSIGPFPLQPTEFVKFALILYMASTIDRKRDRMGSFTQGVLPFVVLLGVLGAIVLSQPDLGMLIMYGALVAAMLFVGGAQVKHLLVIGAISVPAIFVAVWIAPYRFARLLSFLDPHAYSTSSGYQVLQSLTAIGAGGLFGRGLGASRAKLFYLPQAHNDFILAIVGEEMGLIGTVAILALLALLVARAFQIAERAPDRLGRLIGYGVGFCVGFQTLVNAGVAVGVLPVTGLTLPFVSNGGSSLLVTLGLVGVLLNISKQGAHR
ncbi:MAG: putative lipid II flippase FtsW [Candidatus Bipolaricaulia bacterium]